MIQPIFRNAQRSTKARLDDLLARMTLRQKVGQLVQADGRVNAEQQVQEMSAGSFLHILGEKTEALQKLAEQTEFGIPLLFGIDAIHGHGFWPGATVFPTQLALSCSWNPERVKQMCQVTAREMLCTGLHWTFSPVLCLTRDLRWGRVGETFGEDPYLIGKLGRAAIEGYQGDNLKHENSVLACAKHYVGYSETVGGRDSSEAQLSRRRLHSEFLPPFREAVKAGCATFMTGYQCIDGVSCVVNTWLNTQILRKEWGFEGFVVTDWDNVGRLVRQQFVYDSLDTASPDALRAGNDMIMVTPEFYEATVQAVEAGVLPEEEVDTACRRILRLKFELGLFDEKRHPKSERIPEVVGCDAHRAALLPAALESIVLLKNAADNGTPLLPLSQNIRRLGVFGCNADDALAQLGDWSFGSGQADFKTSGHPAEKVKTVLAGLCDRAKNADIVVTYERGCDALDNDVSRLPAATALAEQSDVLVCVVGDVLEQVGEECDRSELDLSGSQLPLLKVLKATQKPLIVVLINSKPLCIPWVADNADAILEAFNPGMEGGSAVAKIIFGDESPQGKLTVSFPRKIGDQPVYYSQPPGWHGSKYGNYDPTPLYAFGFGLSYTTFEYSELTLSTKQLTDRADLTVSVNVSNTGTRTGTEIAQLYFNDIVTKLTTPTKQLRGFQRVHLAPGQTKTLRFELDHESLCYVGANEELTLEPGEFEIMVGGSSLDRDLLKTRFQYSN